VRGAVRCNIGSRRSPQLLSFDLRGDVFYRTSVLFSILRK
jgi:hypothetical protein